MTAEKFNMWLSAMKGANIVNRESHCRDLLGISHGTFYNYKRTGAPYHIALACSALLYKKKAYGE